MGRAIGWLALGFVGLVFAGIAAIWVFKALLGLAFYLLVGALVVGGGFYLYHRMKDSIGADSRLRRRVDAARATFRNR